MFKEHQQFLEEEQWGPSRGYIPAFKCQGWSNGGKNQTPKTSLGRPTKPQKNPMLNFQALKFSRKHSTMNQATQKKNCQSFVT